LTPRGSSSAQPFAARAHSTVPALARAGIPSAEATRARDAVPYPAEMSVPGALAGSALWLMASNLLFAACQWGTVVALAKLGAPISLGLLGLALAVATPVVLVTGFALRAYQATDVFGRFAFAEYLNLRLVANVVAGAIIVAAAVAGGLEPAAVAIVIPIGAAKIAEATSETCYGCAQRHDRMRFVAISRVARGALGLVALVAVVGMGGSLAAGAWALAAAWAAFLVAVDLPVASALEPIFVRTRLDRLWSLARESAPLGGVSGVYAVAQNVPRYFLEVGHGAEAVGYFTALASVVPALSQVATAICHAAAPRLGWTSGDARRYRVLVLQLLGVAVALGAALTVGAALGGRHFLAFAYAADYAVYRGTFIVIVAAAAFGIVNEVLYFAMLAIRKLHAQLVIQAFGLALTALACAVLVPRYSVTGAAAAAALAAGAMAVASGWVVFGGRVER